MTETLSREHIKCAAGFSSLTLDKTKAWQGTNFVPIVVIQ